MLFVPRTYVSPYKDADSDNYGYKPRGLRGLGMDIPKLPDLIGYGSGAGAPGGTTSGGATCTACPPNCETITKRTTYYAHKEKLSDTDRPVVVNRKQLKCTPNQGALKPICEQNLQALKKRLGLNGLSGCSSCSGGYSSRM